MLTAEEPKPRKERKPLPCPCCGGEAIVLDEEFVRREALFTTRVTYYHVRCNRCLLRTTASESRDAVVRKWNRRTGSRK